MHDVCVLVRTLVAANIIEWFQEEATGWMLALYAWESRYDDLDIKFVLASSFNLKIFILIAFGAFEEWVGARICVHSIRSQ